MPHWMERAIAAGIAVSVSIGCLGARGAPAAASPGPVTLDVNGGRVALDIEDGLPNEAITRWVESSARAVGSWYQHFPVAEVKVHAEAVDGPGVGFATTWPGDPPRIEIPVGRRAGPEAFARDWVLVHEMTHLAFPTVADEHHWIEEGLATYLEPWERVGVGTLSPEAAWHDFARDLHKGLPEAGDQGLDHTHTWGRTYWGGALYCFVADVEIRHRTGNKLGLRDAVVAISRLGGMAGGGERDLGAVLAVGDDAVGMPILTDTWRAMADAPVSPDIDAMFRDLGVELAGDTVIFHDDAPDAAIRQAIAPGPADGAARAD